MSDLRVENLRLGYGIVDVLKGISFDLASGKVLALLGPSGCGKTTLLRTLAGLELPLEGRITVGKELLFDSAAKVEVPPEKRNLGLVFQSYALWPHKTVFANVAFPLELKKTSAGQTKQRVAAVLDSLGLGALAERFPHQLSGGQQQRVAIARAVVHRPPLILLDEPLSNLDAKLREEARLWMRQMIDELGLTAVFVTHDQTEALAIADDIVLLSGGRVEQQGSPQALYEEPRTLAAAEFMGANNRMNAVVRACDGSRTEVMIGDRPLHGVARRAMAAGETCDALIRLERVEIGAEPSANSLPMRLKTSIYLGERWECLFEADGVTMRCYSQKAVPDGVHHLKLPEANLWLF